MNIHHIRSIDVFLQLSFCILSILEPYSLKNKEQSSLFFALGLTTFECRVTQVFMEIAPIESYTQ